jgi:hypothetical protein
MQRLRKLRVLRVFEVRDFFVYNNQQICILLYMKYDELVNILGKQGWFDLAAIAQLSGERRELLRVQLHRWCRSGKLLPLRRGMYAFPDCYSGRIINPAELANKLYAPSYLSSYWALGYFGMIPESVPLFTSISSRVPRVFDNHFGVFRYQNVKQSAFFGYHYVDISYSKVLLAEPEKALLDLWHLEKGDWTQARMVEMRFQGFGIVVDDKLRQYALQYDSKRLRKAVEVWLKLKDEQVEIEL